LDYLGLGFLPEDKTRVLSATLLIEHFFSQKEVLCIKIIQAYYNGSVFVPLTPVKATLNQPVLISVLDFMEMEKHNNRYEDFFGVLSDESLLEITEALKDTERVDMLEW
jgi:hypothetical protein